MDDPFAMLGLRPGASPASVHAAYRRLAKRLHPDVPGTGNAEAFQAIRRAYDRARLHGIFEHPAPSAANEPGPEHVGAWAFSHAGRDMPGWEDAVRPQAGPRPHLRFGGLRLMAMALAAGIALGAGLKVYERAARVAAPPSGVQDPGPPAENGEGEPYYVRPATAPAMLFRYDGEARRYVVDGSLPAFAPVRRLRAVADTGMAEVRTQEAGPVRYMLGVALQGGDARVARVSQCVYAAGRPPAHGEIFRAGPQDGAGRAVPVENRGDLPGVFALRDGSGRIATQVFLAPHATATLPPLGPGTYRAEYATGDLWSRSCSRFVAGSRAARARLAGPLADRYVLPLADVVELPNGALAD